MSLSAVRHQPLYPDQRISEVGLNNRTHQKDWSYLIPTIGTLALGAMYVPNVPIGMAVGVGSFAASVVVLIAASALNLLEEDEDNEYERILSKSPLKATLLAPFLEEGFFRGCMQPLVARCIIYLAPAAAAAFLGTGLSIAMTVSIVATAAFFGFIHIFNDHKNSPIQAFSATLGGILLGVSAAQFGLGCAIAAHIVHNTIITTLKKFGKEESPATLRPAPGG